MTVVSQYCLPVYVGSIIISDKKGVSYLYRTAQPSTLAAFRPWGSSTGAGRIRLTRCKNTNFFDCTNDLIKNYLNRKIPDRIASIGNFCYDEMFQETSLRDYFSISFFSLSVNIGTILWRSPTMPRSAAEKIGAYLSLLMAMMKSDSSIPARCWIAPEIPHAI